MLLSLFKEVNRHYVSRGLRTTLYSPESLWERARPPYFDVYRDGKFLANVPAKIAYYQQDVTIFENPNEPRKLSDFSILFPHCSTAG